MNFSYYTSGVGLLKVASGVLGLISLCLGTVSHFASDWKRQNLHGICRTPCNSINIQGDDESYTPWFGNEIFTFKVTCPNIELEVVYVAVIIMAFIISTIFVLMTAIKSTVQKQHEFKYLDIAFHGIFCPLIIATACTLIYSASKIDQLLDSGNLDCVEGLHEMQFLTGGKIVAGILSLKLGVLYGVIAYNIIGEVKSGEDSHYYIME